jgi:hypothetical protein
MQRTVLSLREESPVSFSELTPISSSLVDILKQVTSTVSVPFLHKIMRKEARMGSPVLTLKFEISNLSPIMLFKP